MFLESEMRLFFMVHKDHCGHSMLPGWEEQAGSVALNFLGPTALTWLTTAPPLGISLLP